MIESYSFGEIIINGIKYTSDIIVFPDRVEMGWRRREGHNLAAEDLEIVFDYKPETLIIGTGYSGMMKVPDKTSDTISAKGIDTVMMKTKDACAVFNRLLSASKNVAGAFHITC